MSRRIIVSTIVRYAAAERSSGFVYELDLASGATKRRLVFPESLHRSRDPNPRGGLRGLRGIAVHGGRLVVANADRLLLFDLEWNPRGELTHPWLGGIHGLHADPDGVWVCCTNADLLVKATWDGDIVEEWEWRRDASLRETFGLRRLSPIDRELDYRDPQTMRSGVPNVVHLNSVAPAPDGGILVSFGRILSPIRYRRARVAGQAGAMARWLDLPPLRRGRGRPLGGRVGSIPGSSSAIVRLRTDGGTEVLAWEKGTAVPNHDVWMEGRTLLYNDSNKGHLVVVDLDGDAGPRRIPVPGASSFVRGLARLSPTCFLVGGHGPAAIHQVDLQRGEVTRTVPIGGDPGEAIFAIQPVPVC